MITVEKMVYDKRIVKNLTQSDLAERLGVHKQLISNFEREVCRIPLKYFSTIARMLGMNLELMIEVRIANMSEDTRKFFK